jgi:hypothetical protein
MAVTLPISQLPMACTYWLEQEVNAIITSINTAIQSYYTVEAYPALFATAAVIGELPNVDIPTIAIWAENGSQPRQLDISGLQPTSRVSLLYKIRIVIPRASTIGGNTPSDFELSKQCALGTMAELLWDTTKVLQPIVSPKSDPTMQIKALGPCKCGDWRSVFAKPLSDDKTLVRSVEMSFTFQFQINSGVVVSSP